MPKLEWATITCVKGVVNTCPMTYLFTGHDRWAWSSVQIHTPHQMQRCMYLSTCSSFIVTCLLLVSMYYNLPCHNPLKYTSEIWSGDLNDRHDVTILVKFTTIQVGITSTIRASLIDGVPSHAKGVNGFGDRVFLQQGSASKKTGQWRRHGRGLTRPTRTKMWCSLGKNGNNPFPPPTYALGFDF